jgi:hypothetical protein
MLELRLLGTREIIVADEERPSRADRVREGCAHDWQRVGFEERTSVLISVIYVCEKCSSFTYREMRFVNYRINSLEDELADQAGGGGG